MEAAKLLFNKAPIKISDRLKYNVQNPGYIQMDLIDMNEPKCKYILTIIEVYTRYGYAYPLMNKTPTQILPFIKLTIDDIKSKLDLSNNKLQIVSDMGSEFKGSVSKYFKDNKIQYTPINPILGKGRTAIVERFNYTVRHSYGIIKATYPKMKALEIIKMITESYNDKLHSTTECTPNSMIEDECNPPKIDNRSYKQIKPKTLVIVKLPERWLNTKSNLPKYGSIIYRVLQRVGNRYVLVEDDNPLETLHYRPLATDLKVLNTTQANQLRAFNKKNPSVVKDSEKQININKLDKRNKRDFKGDEYVQVSWDSVILKDRLKPKSTKRQAKVPDWLTRDME